MNLSETEALALLARNRENYQTHLKNHFAHGGTREVRRIPPSKRALVEEILDRVTVRLRDW